MMTKEQENIEEYVPDINSDQETLRELSAGIVLMGVIGQIFFLIFKMSVLVSWCWWIGIVLAVTWAVHMRNAIKAAVSLSENDAIVQMKKNAVIRYMIAVLVMVVLYYRLEESERVYAIAYLAGIYMMKLGAYLQPFVHKVFVLLGLSKPYPEGKALPEDIK